MDDFNRIFGFPTEGLTWTGSDFKPDAAWNQLTGQPLYSPSRSKASALRNPALRYIHRVMAMSLFGRGESTGAVNKVELFLLWGMANNIKINTGVWLLRQLLHVAKSPIGKICCGGVLTLIAFSYGFVPVDNVYTVIEGSHLVDIDTLINMRMCRHVGQGNFILLDEGGHAVQREFNQDEQIPQEEDFWNEEFNQGQPHYAEQPGHHDYEAGPSSSTAEYSMNHLVERLDRMESRFGERIDRLETRMDRSDELQLQMMNIMQQTADTAARIEERLSHMK